MRAAPPAAAVRAWAVISTAGAALLGAAPHVLHHAGPVAGAAAVAGATGTVLFGLLGFVLSVPFLRRLRRRTGSWRRPAAVLVLMAVSFGVSTSLAGSGDSGDRPGPATHDRPAHESHHR